VGVLLIALWESLRGRERVVLCGRTISARRVLDAMTLTLTVCILFIGGAMVLSAAEGILFIPAAYEVASALGTVGLSMGVTPGLSAPGSLLIALFMYMGRVGILSFSVAFMIRQGAGKLRYPVVDVLIG